MSTTQVIPELNYVGQYKNYLDVVKSANKTEGTLAMAKDRVYVRFNNRWHRMREVLDDPNNEPITNINDIN